MPRFDFDSLQSLKISAMPKAHKFFARIEPFCTFREVVIDEKYSGVKKLTRIAVLMNIWQRMLLSGRNMAIRLKIGLLLC